MDLLLLPENQLFNCKLNNNNLKKYSEQQRDDSKNKNKSVMKLINFMFVVISIPFLFIMESDEIAGFLGIIFSIVALIYLSSKFIPYYYYKKNIKGDGLVLIGEKFAYFNGVFHNWDYPLSGLSKVEIIKKPFYGLYIAYYYTDVTFEHISEIKIPADENSDFTEIVFKLKNANKKKKK